MDPRRANYNTDAATKRKASQSPAGSSRKSAKASPLIALTTRGPPGSAVTDDSRPAAQLQTELIAGSELVASPSSNGQRYEDATSGRSTPKDKTIVTLQQPRPDNSGTNASTTAIDMLLSFSESTASLSSAQVRAKLAEERVGTARKEYEAMKPRFLGFPAIRDQKTIALTRAEGHLKTAQAELDAESKLHHVRVRNVAALLDKPAEVAPVLAPSSDHVSRAQYDLLCDQHQKLEQRFSQLEDRAREHSAALRDARSEVADSKADRLRLQGNVGQIPVLQSYMNADKEWKRSAEPSIKLIEGLDGRVKAVTELATASTSPSALQGKLKTLEAGLARIDSRTDDLEQGIHEEGKESVIKRLKKHDQLINNLTMQSEIEGKPLKQLVKQVELDLDKLMHDVKDDRAKVAALSAAAAHKGQSGNAVTASDDAGVDMGSAIGRVDKAQADVKRLEAFITESQFMILGDFDTAIADLKNEMASLREAWVRDVKDNDEKLAAIRETNQSAEARTTRLNDEIERSTHSLISEAKLTGDARSAQLESKIELLSKDVNEVKASVGRHSQDIQAIRTKVTENSTHGPAPSGVRPQQQPNGVMNSPRTNSPQINGARSIQQQHQGPSNQDLLNRMDMLTGVTNRLQVQYNNITTDEVVRAMVDQFSQMYPHAKQFNAAVNEVKAQLAQMNTDLQNLRQQHSVTSGNFVAARNSAEGERVRLTTIANATTDALNGQSKRMNESLAKFDGALGAVQDRVTKLETTEQAASPPGPLPAAIQKDLAAVDKRVLGLEKHHQNLYRSVELLEESAASPANKGTEALKSRVTDIEKNVQALPDKQYVDKAYSSSRPSATPNDALVSRVAAVEKKLELKVDIQTVEKASKTATQAREHALNTNQIITKIRTECNGLEQAQKELATTTANMDKRVAIVEKNQKAQQTRLANLDGEAKSKDLETMQARIVDLKGDVEDHATRLLKGEAEMHELSKKQASFLRKLVASEADIEGLKTLL